MKGVLFNIVEEIVIDLFDADTWDDNLDAAGVDGAYTALGNYEDADLVAIASAVASATDQPASDVWQLVGRLALPKLMAHLGDAAPEVSSATELLSSVNGIIHPEVRMVYPDATPPVFECEPTGDGGLRVRYRSKRRLDDLAIGLMTGCGEYFDEPASITTLERDGLDDHEVMFEVRYAAATD